MKVTFDEFVKKYFPKGKANIFPREVPGIIPYRPFLAMIGKDRTAYVVDIPGMRKTMKKEDAVEILKMFYEGVVHKNDFSEEEREFIKKMSDFFGADIYKSLSASTDEKKLSYMMFMLFDVNPGLLKNAIESYERKKASERMYKRWLIWRKY